MKQITEKNLLYSTGNPTQYSVMAYAGKESKNKVDINISDSLCCTSGANTALETKYTPMKNFKTLKKKQLNKFGKTWIE